MMDDWCPVKDKNSHEFWIRKDICSDTKEDFEKDISKKMFQFQFRTCICVCVAPPLFQSWLQPVKDEGGRQEKSFGV